MNSALQYHLRGMVKRSVQARRPYGARDCRQHLERRIERSPEAGATGHRRRDWHGQLVAGAILGVANIIQNFFGHPDCSKIATTEIVNQAEQMLKQNLTAWQSLPPAQKTPATPTEL